jgi:hypothetical protein
MATSNRLDMPPFKVEFDSDGSVFVIGGGGESKTGVPNGIQHMEVNPHTLDRPSGSGSTSSPVCLHPHNATPR